MPTEKTELVFADHGSLGAVQVGMLQALVEGGVTFDLGVGASVGAINGAYFAARLNAQGVSELADFWRDLRKTDVFPFSLIDIVMGILRGRGKFLADGGVASNTPIASALVMGATRVIVVPTGVGCASFGPLKGLVALALHTLNLMSMHQLVRDIEVYSSRAAIHVVPPLCPLDMSVSDFNRTGQLLQRAYESTELWIKEDGLFSVGVPHTLQEHTHHFG